MTPGPDAPAAEQPAAPEIDAAGVDRSQIREMLALSPEERLLAAQDHLDSLLEIRKANER